jgi:hypothetical protein
MNAMPKDRRLLQEGVSRRKHAPLDPKEEAIVATYIKNGGNQTEAWKETHLHSKAKPESMHQQASVFFRKLKVRSRIVELQAEVASQSVTAAALTLDAHMEELRVLRDEARQRGQLSAAIQAEVKRGKLRRFYVKQVESGEAGEFDRMTDDELREYIAGQDKILASLDGKPKH